MRNEFFNNTGCQRCGKKTSVFTMSRFNTERICPECEAKEKNHKDYKKAVEAELAAVRSGNYNFAGIGKPADL